MQFAWKMVPFGSVIGIFASVIVGAQAEEATVSSPKTPAVQSTRFDDWYYRCTDVKVSDGKSVAQCEVAQIAQVKQGDQDVNVLTLAIAKTAPEAGKKPSDNDLLLTVLVPLNVVLPIGLGLAADGKDVVTIPYRNCNQSGCWAQQKLDGKMLTALQKGSAGEARLRLMNGQNINLKFSLKGLTKALAELQKPSKA
ncbi:invasion associated locus B family protein [Brucella anthropi]|uniref:Invasion associated locus B family protein n=1 Tax=Brucella anthropi TaxID=529 RepID=A0A8I0N2Q8_BRUAN|nr:invasion associated locus B family protein [Brucella anthropi]MBE0560734.1 invasion associated locus B family protein [Brucella anthropi]WKT93644.1 invasion associated locus B family protein [Brucella anthropi]